MSRFITTKADFTLRRKHKQGSGATVYEHDYTTITPMPNAFKKEYVIGDSNFKFTTRLGINGQKKHTRGKYVPNPTDSELENGAWTLDTIVDSAITDETKVRLKPNYTSIRDFACYGSAVKLIQGTVNGVITDFPAELYFAPNEKIRFYEAFVAGDKTGYTFDDEKPLASEEYLIYNEYGIDITSKSLQETSVYNPLRYFCLCGSSYTLLIDVSGTTYELPFTGFEVEDTAIGEYYNGICVEVDKIMVVTMNFSGLKVGINVYKDYVNDKIYYTYTYVREDTVGVTVDGTFEQGANIEDVSVSGIFTQNGGYTEYVTVGGTLIQGAPNIVMVTTDITLTQMAMILGASPKRLGATRGGSSGDCIYCFDFEYLLGAHIRPNRKIVEEYFSTIDDFTAVILDRTTKPIYTAIFETPADSETGMSYTMESYVWPSLNGGFNPDLSGPYYSYVESLIDLGEFYDEYFTDNMWRSLTHEAIKTLDWTYISNTNGDIQDMSTIDTSRIEPITKIYGRQFDDLKRYADGIKTVNTITYNQKSNAPDYVLTDLLENSGWETKTLKITTDKDIRTDPLYSAHTMGYTSSEANNEFLRRLKLNSEYLFSIKGTRKGLDSMLALFGFTPNEYSIHEYIFVASGNSGNYTKFCADTQGKSFPYPLAKDVATINKFKINFNANDPYGNYCGIPVAEVGYFVDGADYSYVVPWYSQDKQYDDGLYFQMNGGWGKRKEKKIDLEIAPEITTISETNEVKLYDETQARLKFAQDFDDLLQEAFAGSKVNDVFYVTDIGKISDDYTFKSTDSKTGLSHYFILENADLYQFLGYSTEKSAYGWRNIKESEITGNTTPAGTLVLYLESIQDDTTGNNPHIGNGTYDDGVSYVESVTDIFGHSLINKNFIGIDDDTCARISGYTFYKEKQEDNRKCWFFSDNYNKKLGKYSEEITFKEADVTSDRCDIRTFYDVFDVLSGAGQNQEVNVGRTAGDYFQSGDVYTRGSSANTFDPETNSHGAHGEAAANSIINVKNLNINFNLCGMLGNALPFFDEMTDYINNTVIPYLTQMIPSTTILSWSFNCESSGKPETEYVTVEGELEQNSGETITDVTYNVTGRIEQTYTPPVVIEVEYRVIGSIEQDEPHFVDRTYNVIGTIEQEPPHSVEYNVTGTIEQVPPEFVTVTGTLTQSFRLTNEEYNVTGTIEQEGAIYNEEEYNVTGTIEQDEPILTTVTGRFTQTFRLTNEEYNVTGTIEQEQPIFEELEYSVSGTIEQEHPIFEDIVYSVSGTIEQDAPIFATVTGRFTQSFRLTNEEYDVTGTIEQEQPIFEEVQYNVSGTIEQEPPIFEETEYIVSGTIEQDAPIFATVNGVLSQSFRLTNEEYDVTGTIGQEQPIFEEVEYNVSGTIEQAEPVFEEVEYVVSGTIEQEAPIFATVTGRFTQSFRLTNEEYNIGGTIEQEAPVFIEENYSAL